jgi:hypothetical protein
VTIILINVNSLQIWNVNSLQIWLFTYGPFATDMLDGPFKNLLTMIAVHFEMSTLCYYFIKYEKQDQQGKAAFIRHISYDILGKTTLLNEINR